MVVLGTGGTIAGTARSEADHVGYQPAQLGVAELIEAVPALAAWTLESEQIAQLDSKDMGPAVWQQLAVAVQRQLERAEVAGVVITHGTDTLEETAYFLHRVLAASKPVVLTAAMRPATAMWPDGPQNLLDAVRLAALPGAHGVLAVLNGVVHGAPDLRKRHTYRLDAFDSGDAGAVGVFEQGNLRRFRDWPVSALALSRDVLSTPLAHWPRVALLMSHAGVDAEVAAALSHALCQQKVAGIVVAGTGNGTIHTALEAALRVASAAGVVVWRASRCAYGAVLDADDEPAAGHWPGAGACTAVQARIELMLQLLDRNPQEHPAP